MRPDWGRRWETVRLAGATARRLRSEVDEELAFHMEERVRELEAKGLSPAAARREALRRFGDLARTREVCVREDLSHVGRRRRRDYLEALRLDVRQGLRQMRRHRLLSAVAVGTLALGIGASTALFSVADHVLLRPLPYAASDRAVAVWQSDSRTGATRQGVPPANFADWEARTTRFRAWGLAEPSGFDETGGDRPMPLEAWLVTAGFFEALGVRPLLGRLPAPEEYETDGGVVILGHRYWQRRFGGDAGVVDGTIELDGLARRVIGVLSPEATYPEDRSIWMPKRLSEADLRNRFATHMFAVARLSDDATLASAASELTAVSARLAAEHPATNAATAGVLVPLDEQVLGPVRPALLVLLGAVMLVLLIACANVSGLLLARDVERGRELAVRAALGAGRRRLVHQMLTESATLAAAGGALGVLVAWLAVRLFHATAPADLPRAETVALDGRVLLFAAVVTGVTAVILGVLPALRASRRDPAHALRGGGRGSTGGYRRDRAHRWLVTGEVAVAFVLVIGAGLLVRSFVTLLRNEPGFAVEGRALLQAHLWDRNPSAEQRIQRAEAIEAAFAATPGVVGTGITTAAPFHAQRVDPQSSLVVQGRPQPRPEEEERVVTILASPGYFAAMGIAILRGRGFEVGDRLEAPRVVVLNETAARRSFPGEDPVGRRVTFGVFGAPQEWEVVGVARDTRPAGLDTDAQPEVFVPFAQHGFGSVTWVVHVGGDAAGALPLLHERLWEVDPGQSVYTAATVEQLIRSTLVVRRFHLLLLGSLSAVALALAAIGVYGLVSFWTQARMREIGVRMALGARAPDVFRLILGDALRLAAPGVLVGAAAALVLTRSMRSMLYGVASTDPITYLPLAALMLIVTALAAIGPAHRAVRGDPVAALRSE